MLIYLVFLALLEDQETLEDLDILDKFDILNKVILNEQNLIKYTCCPRMTWISYEMKILFYLINLINEFLTIFLDIIH
jgi:hypothetical protein